MRIKKYNDAIRIRLKKEDRLKLQQVAIKAKKNESEFAREAILNCLKRANNAKR